MFDAHKAGITGSDTDYLLISEISALLQMDAVKAGAPDIIQFEKLAPQIAAEIARHRGGHIVLKLSGKNCDSRAEAEPVATAIALCVRAGITLTVVHGAGKQIDEQWKSAGLEKQTHEGLRVTPAEAIPLVRNGIQAANDLLVSLVNEKLAGTPHKAVTLPGDEVIACKQYLDADGLPRCGNVGVPVGVKESAIAAQHAHGNVVFVTSMGYATDETSGKKICFNVNADDVAEAIARHDSGAGVHLLPKTHRLIMMSDRAVEDGQGNHIPLITPELADELIAREVVVGGMQKKVRSIVSCLEAGVEAVPIIPKTAGIRGLIEELFTSGGCSKATYFTSGPDKAYMPGLQGQGIAARL
ncbi:MAG: hypothetical protein AB7G06_05725 [Bdellovibrionales bacterium]